MPSHPSDPPEAVVICTRNRSEELAQTLESIAAHPPSVDLLLAVIDASDDEERKHTRTIVENFDALPSVHWSHSGVPSLARQRNAALDRLPSSVEIVHFIDDDVTVHANYFDRLSRVLDTHSEIGGVGGVVEEPQTTTASDPGETLKRLFFLSHTQAGRVLPSGCTTSAQHPTSNDEGSLRNTEWLSGCSSSYRRSLLQQDRFDEDLRGYAMLEDLDLSYRIHQRTRLVVETEARLTHRRSPRNRLNAERYSHALTVHRRWFVEKHFDDFDSRLAFWWSLVGRFLAIIASSAPHRRAALRGLIRGVKAVLRREHPLLTP